MAHVRSAETKTTVQRSREELMRLVERYGGAGFGYDVADGGFVVRFSFPRDPSKPKTSEQLRVEIPVKPDRVAAAMKRAKSRGTVNADQAERVAWRNAVLWIEATLAAISIGFQDPEEAFHAHLIVATDDGQRGRLGDYVATLRTHVGNGGALPAPGAEFARRALPAGRA